MDTNDQIVSVWSRCIRIQVVHIQVHVAAAVDTEQVRAGSGEHQLIAGFGRAGLLQFMESFEGGIITTTELFIHVTFGVICVVNFSICMNFCE